MQPQTRYAVSGDVNIAYQVIGDGPIDLVFVMGWVSNIDEFWTEPSFANFLLRLARFSRLIVFDKRGTGLSDRVDEKRLPTIEQRMDDVRAVMDAAGSKKAALFGISEGGPMCIVFAATYPDRVHSLMTFGSYAAARVSDGYPYGRSAEVWEKGLEDIRTGWGRRPVGLELRFRSRSNDEAFKQWWMRYQVRSVTPRAALVLTEMNSWIDVRPALPAISAPTLIMHRTGDPAITVEGSRYMANAIRGARLLEFPGLDHAPWTENGEAVLAEIEAFVTGTRPVEEADRVLATIMFTDIVGSTEMTARLGDVAATELIRAHDALVRRALARHDGREVKHLGDGIMASFESALAAVECARAIQSAFERYNRASAEPLHVRIGLDCGEPVEDSRDLFGSTVQCASRMCGAADADQILVSARVREECRDEDGFTDCGLKSLKGFSQPMHIFGCLW